MVVVVHFDWRINTQQQLDLLALTICTVDHERDFLLRLDVIFQAQQVVAFIAGNAER